MQNENSWKHSSQVCHLDTALILYISKIRVDLVPNKTEKEGVFSWRWLLASVSGKRDLKYLPGVFVF